MRTACLVVSVMLISGCTAWHGKIKLIEGNFYFSRGMMNEAIAAYLDAETEAFTAPYANFALGAAYLVLEQTGPAIERFTLAETSLPAGAEHRVLRYRIQFNRAVAHFERGEFHEAAAGFRAALELDNSARDAKRNLELSLISLHRKSQMHEVLTTGTGAVRAGNKERGEIIFDYVRRRETDRWKSWEWAGESADTGPDY
ncbi:MAG: tetratricopeptide repeat protein [Spirochaetaceae bacterium]|nr:tetratricopeptide repeat protein [Spirochaetaceae bacterium]